MKRSVLPWLCAAASLYAARANAQTSAPLELTWNAPDGCPGQSTVLAKIQKIAGPSKANGAPLRADATITQQPDRLFHLRLAIQSGELSAERNIEGKSCKDLAGAAAVALALLLSSGEPLSEHDLAGDDPGLVPHPDGSGDKPPNTENTNTKPPEPPKPSEPPEPSVYETERGTHGVLVAPLGALGFGPTRQTARGLGLAAGVSVEGWQFLAEGKLWASQRATITNLGDEYGVDLHRFTVSLRGCHSLWKARFELAPCVLMSVQHLSVRGSGPNLVPQTDSTLWLAAGVGARARVRILRWFGLVAGIDGELQFSRPEINLKGVGFVERLSPAAATITVGSEWIF
ncbi:MAG: hypothetical protein ABUL62_14865 [Myxococcales bacterium]